MFLCILMRIGFRFHLLAICIIYFLCVDRRFCLNDDQSSRSLWMERDDDFLAGLDSFAPTNEDEERLTIDMFERYNPLLLPSPCHNKSVVYVEFGVAMILLINVDEKNQIMQTNVWQTLKWNDCQFGWRPDEYGGLESMRVPMDRVWTPDIVLFNNADGNYEVSYHSNVVVDYQGNVTWVPPAIYKSSCRIDVEYFPFDEQVCALIFGSWTYNSNEVKLKWYNNKKAVELTDYSPSGIWDVMEAPGELIQKQSKVAFLIRIRRKTLFYTVILIIPTVLMAFLSMLVFYLPAECSEKITLAISILLALVVFLLLVSKILPPTSDTIPLMAKYLLLTFILNILTIMATVIIINVYFRSATTHTMPNCIRNMFLQLLPTLLMMRRPERIPIYNGYFVEEYCVEEIFDSSLIMPSITATILPFTQVGRMAAAATPRRNQPQYPESHHRNCTRIRQTSVLSKKMESSFIELSARPPILDRVPEEETTSRTRRSPAKFEEANVAEKEFKARPFYKSVAPKDVLSGRYTFGPKPKHSFLPEKDSDPLRTAEYNHEQRISKELKSTVESIAYIAEHMKAEMSDKKVRDDWKYVAMVIDRLLLIVFFGITMGGTIGILFSAPHVWDYVDQQEILRKLIAESKGDAED